MDILFHVVNVLTVGCLVYTLAVWTRWEWQMRKMRRVYAEQKKPLTNAK